jgi:hypothetical protein
LRRRGFGSGPGNGSPLPELFSGNARLECKSYKIPQPDIEPLISEPEIEPLSGLDHDEELPLFLRPPETTEVIGR